MAPVVWILYHYLKCNSKAMVSSTVIYLCDSCILDRIWLRAKEKEPIEAAQKVSPMWFLQLQSDDLNT